MEHPSPAHKLLAKILELISGECFGQHIRDLVAAGNVLNSDVAIRYVLSEMEKPCGKMLRSRPQFRLLGHFNARGVILERAAGDLWLDKRDGDAGSAQFLEQIHHVNGFSEGRRERNYF